MKEQNKNAVEIDSMVTKKLFLALRSDKFDKAIGDHYEESKYKLLLRIAQECSENDFSNFVSNGEIPPLKLSSREMHLMSGGVWSWVKKLVKEFSDWGNSMDKHSPGWMCGL